MRSDEAITVEVVRRLFAALERPIAGARAMPEPWPDVEVTLSDGRIVLVEQTDYSGDEGSDVKGSAMRKEDAHALKANPSAWSGGLWGSTNFIEPFTHRIEEKTRKTYKRRDGQELWLLVSANIPAPGRLRASFIFPTLPKADEMNARTHELLAGSTFDGAYLQGQLGNGLCSWSREAGWRIERPPQIFHEGLATLQLIGEHHQGRKR